MYFTYCESDKRRWIPACAGMTEKKSAGRQIGNMEMMKGGGGTRMAECKLFLVFIFNLIFLFSLVVSLFLQ
jgi:hypothetical protein